MSTSEKRRAATFTRNGGGPAMVATDSILDRIWIGTPGNMFPLVHPDLGGLLYNVHMYNVTSKPDFQSCSGSATLPHTHPKW